MKNESPFKKLSSEEKMALSCIGHIFLEEYNNDYVKTHMILDAIGTLQIKYKPKSLFHKQNVFYISLERPGILIGLHGQLISKIQKALSEKHKRKIIIKVFPSQLYDFLYPQDYKDWEDIF